MIDTRKTVFLTGATGNMGRETVKRIAAKADSLHLRILVRPEEKAHPVVKDVQRRGLAEIIWGDLTDPASIREGVKGADIVLHVGALVSPLADRLPTDLVTRVNVGGAQNIVDAIHAVGDPKQTRLIYIGTVAETGSRNAPVAERDNPLGLDTPKRHGAFRDVEDFRPHHVPQSAQRRVRMVHRQ